MTRVLLIVVASLLLVMVGGLIWLTGRPRITPLLSAEEAEQLDAQLPSDIEQGNRLTTYCDLASMYDTLLGDVASAKQYVHMEFFKFEDDATARRLGDAMAERAAAGVETRLMYDDFMCRRWRPYYGELRRRGVQTLGFGRVRWQWVRKTDYYRTHRKMVVVDGRVAYVGGFNIADRYLHGLPWGCWRDTVVRIEGPAALAVQRAFAADWRWSGGELLAQQRYFPAVEPLGTRPVRIVTSGPIGDGPTLMHLTTGWLDRAEHYAWFESPYFIPPDEVRTALLRAARRGVDVRVLLPPRGDRGELTQWASQSYFAEALSAGVRIGLYRPGYLHSKLVVCDDRVAMVGSCNMDPRSYQLCQEMGAVVEERSFAEEIREVFLADEARSTLIDADAWAERPVGQRTKESMARLVAPLL